MSNLVMFGRYYINLDKLLYARVDTIKNYEYIAIAYHLTFKFDNGKISYSYETYDDADKALTRFQALVDRHFGRNVEYKSNAKNKANKLLNKVDLLSKATNVQPSAPLASVLHDEPNSELTNIADEGV